MILTWILLFISVLCLHWSKKTGIKHEDNEKDQLDPFVWIIASISQRGECSAVICKLSIIIHVMLVN